MKKQIIQAVLYCLLLVTSVSGQGWEKQFSVDSIPRAYFLEATSDGGYVVGGSYGDSVNYPESITYFIKTDANGDTLWTKKYRHDERGGNTYDVKQTTDGGYILAGNSRSMFNSLDVNLTKLDANGDTLWYQVIDLGARDIAYSVEQTTDGGFIISGEVNYNGFLTKTDATGNVIWTKTYPSANNLYTKIDDVEQTPDGGYILTGNTTSYGGGNPEALLIKTDASGNTIWTKIMDDALGHGVRQTSDGGYIWIGGSRSSNSIPGNYKALLVKTDAVGDTLWTGKYESNPYNKVSYVVETVDGGYVFTGNYLESWNSETKAYIRKVNAQGVEQWIRDFGEYGLITAGEKCLQVGNEFILVGGQKNPWGAARNVKDILLIKTDSLGNLYSNNIKGNVFNDLNFNCVKELGEPNIANFLIEAIGWNRSWYGTADNLGNYCIPVDTGTYTVNVYSPPYWQSCVNSVPTTFTNFYVNNTIDFPLQAQVNYPLMEVDLSAPFVRTNANGSDYTVYYCNKGTIDASNVSIEVQIDADLDILGSNIAITNQVGNTLTFNIGTVAYNTCGSFTIQVRANTNAILGQTHCSQAHIYPDSLCLPNPWTGAVINPTVNCQNDSVAFKLENIGGGLFNSETYYVFEDHFIMRTGNTGNIPVAGSFDLTIPADTGKTYRMSVAQNTGFPKLLGDSIASVAIEGCVPYLDGTFNTGFITQFSNGNSAPFIAVDCQPNRGSYDPNDKSAQPRGYDSLNYIYNYTDLDYKIRFQNTGTDTAFLVVIRDTISPLLDLKTLKMGASSHNYTWRVYGNRVLEITFENIMLLDSNVNEPASNGFVRYRIEQNEGNVVGDIIYNAADIYFDFNMPIRTNTTFHTIGDNFVTIILDQPKVLGEVIDVKVYPNPFTRKATIQVEGKSYDELQLSIYDISGRTILEKQAYSNDRIELSRENLQAGIYLYQLFGDNELINTGKIIVQ